MRTYTIAVHWMYTLIKAVLGCQYENATFEQNKTIMKQKPILNRFQLWNEKVCSS